MYPSENRFPMQRDEWAYLSWQEAQMKSVDMLRPYGYMRFHEKNQYGKRLDGFVMKSTLSENIYGVVEVKHYNTTPLSMLKKTLRQTQKYMINIARLVSQSNRNTNKSTKIFGVAVFTKDFPVTNLDTTKLLSKCSAKFSSYDFDIFYVRPENFLEVLRSHKLIDPPQDSLDEYFTKI